MNKMYKILCYLFRPILNVRNTNTNINTIRNTNSVI